MVDQATFSSLSLDTWALGSNRVLATLGAQRYNLRTRAATKIMELLEAYLMECQRDAQFAVSLKVRWLLQSCVSEGEHGDASFASRLILVRR